MYVPLPKISPGALTNLLGVAGLFAIVFAIGSLTNWRWGVLTAGLFAVVLTVIAQAQQSQATPAGASVTPIAAARSRIAAEAERVQAEFPRVEATG